MKLILIKYGELTTKKENRNFFVKSLSNNIVKLLDGIDAKITRSLSRMYIESDYMDEVLKKLNYVFGIHGIVICHKVETDVNEIQNKIVDLLKDEDFKTFKVETKRADKRFPIHSSEFSSNLGAYILKTIDCKVDIHNPDITVNVEIRVEGTFIYFKEVRGIGGYPVGVQGKGLLMLSGGIDSPVAGYLALKRGIAIECLYFESPPHTSDEAKNKVVSLAKILNNYSGSIKVHIVPFTEIQETIYSKVPGNYGITIMRRMMYRIAERYAYKRNCKVIINGESIGQVASQTLTSISVINEVVKMPVIRPVACMDKLEIIELAKKIGTYDTSILPFEDCCTIFVPKHPIINPVLKNCIEYEEEISFDKMIEVAIKNIVTIKDLKENKNNLL